MEADSGSRSRKTDPGYIKNRLADPIYPEILFDQCVLQRSCAKRRQTKPSRDQTESLAQMTGVE